MNKTDIADAQFYRPLFCPDCEKSFQVKIYSQYIEISGHTLDCPHCNSLLFIDDGEIVVNFNNYMHNKICSKWPINP